MEEHGLADREATDSHMICVHLDLKGAPPKVSYLAEILPLCSALGANGLLIEYEDTFPYHGELLPLRAEHAYSPQEIREILKLAKSFQLEVIPLVQTFGHMEFVLKHKEFSHLREVEAYPNSLNPHKEQSQQLLQDMISQVMELHPGVRWFHIGSDEVYYLGEGKESQECLSKGSATVEDIFLCHLKAVAAHLVSSYPGVRPIAWDDMFRGTSTQTLTESGVPELVEPMIWDYTPNFDVEERVALVNKYKQCGFHKIWLASAFKGATGANQQLTHIGHHLANHKQWLNVAEKIPRDIVQGVVLTGWQRYDHFSVLCELLPVAIPSLAVCLQVLKNGAYSDQVMNYIKTFLGMQELDLDTFSSDPTASFPGSNVLVLVSQLTLLLKPSLKELLEKNRIVTGWFSPYHRQRKFIHPIMVQQIQPAVTSLLSNWKSVQEELSRELVRIYPCNAVEEWMEENVKPCCHQLQELLEDLNCSLGQ